ncbi:MAG: putative signal transducing protein [Acidobacteriaceae bacterium]
MEPTDPNAAATRAAEEAALTPTTISHCPTLNEAQMLVSLLASFGIEASIEGENYFRMLGSMVPGIDGIRVQVRPADAEAALEILNPGPEPTTMKD